MNSTQRLAHELQAPLLSLELQLRRLEEISADGELVQGCREEVEALKALVTHVLELDDASRPDLSLHTFELVQVLARIEQRFRPIARARGARLSVDASDVALTGDACATERILSILVDNAIKFSSAGSSIDLVVRQDADGIELQVRDNGVGMSDDTRERAFEPFFRADREIPGGGLGLAIAQQLARAQAGALRCESELGRGSTFVLTLPATRP